MKTLNINTIKTTRAQKGAIKAKKAAVATFKAEKRSPFLPYEAEPMSKEELFTKQLTNKHPILLEGWMEGILQYFLSSLLEDSLSLDMVTKEWVLTQACREYLDIHIHDVYKHLSLEDVKTLKGVAEEFGKDIVEAAYYHAGYRMPTQTELDFYTQMGLYLKKNGVEVNWYTFNAWDKNGFNINPLQLKMNTSFPINVFDRDRSESPQQELLLPPTSVLDYLKGWEPFSDEFVSYFSYFREDHLKCGISLEEVRNYLLEGKFRMIKKYSKHLKDRLEAHGLASLSSCIAYQEEEPAWDLVHKVEYGFKVNPKLLKDSILYEVPGITRFHIAFASVIFGENWKEASPYMLQHIFMCNKEVPNNMKKGIATSESLFSWVYDQRLEVDWTVSKSAKVCVLKAIQKEYGVSEQSAEVLLSNPSQIEALRWKARNPQHTLDVLPETSKEEVEGWTFHKVAKDDILNLTIGDVTDCCQKIGGYGEKVCTEGWNDPNSVNYVIKRPSGRIAAHFWAWLAKDGGLVIDSVEGPRSTPTEKVAELIMQFMDNNPELDMYLSSTNYGLTADVKKVISENYELAEQNCPEPITKYSYIDAEGGVYLIL